MDKSPMNPDMGTEHTITDTSLNEPLVVYFFLKRTRTNRLRLFFPQENKNEPLEVIFPQENKNELLELFIFHFLLKRT
jgi:hypothetical protein